MKQNQANSVEQYNKDAAEFLGNHDYQGALNCFMAAVALLPADDIEARARFASNTGHVLVRLERYQEAITAFGDAHDLFMRSGDCNAAAEQVGNCGSVCRDMENWDRALEYYRSALERFEKAGHAPGVADQYSNMAFIHAQQGEPAEAVHYFRLARTLFMEQANDVKTGLCDRNIVALEPFLAQESEPVICATSCCGPRKANPGTP